MLMISIFRITPHNQCHFQQKQLDHVLNSFSSVFSDIPGVTMLATHSITLTTTIPVWSSPYSIPLAHQTAFREEIENLLSLGIIEPPTSKYSSSPMPVSKKDGGIRIVIDVMPFGLTNAPGTFQLLMQQVLRGFENHCLPYIDDIVIFSTCFEDHLAHITSVLSRLATSGLTVKSSKCSWCFRSFDFLGFHVGQGNLTIPAASFIYHLI